ncbi:MAG: NemA protein [Alysiella sp.]|uniref:NemA protein n=1 Tax=Alysiella sp. TaxID=1872483 RepID=UPI0026DCD059|nr:NemA protein [Alysiella sp.]MDO4433486.1 NemA protein [Alysiella sp.]
MKTPTTTILILTSTLFLSACASQGISLGLGLGGNIGRHIGLGTSINIPLGQTAPANTSTDKSGINIIEEHIVTYFDTQGQPTDHSNKNGYYRRLLSKQANGNYWVQDFYSTGEKRTDPMLLTSGQLFIFRTQPQNGSHTVYAINGNIMSQQNFRNGKIVITP